MGGHSRTAIIVAVCVIGLSRVAAAQDLQRDTVATPVDSLYAPESFDAYMHETFGPKSLAKGLLLAGFDQVRGHPEEFPQNARGFEDRLGSRYAAIAISHTLLFGLSRAFDERRVKYQPCQCGDSLSRFAYALLAPMRVDTPTERRLSLLFPFTEVVSGILVTTTRAEGLKVGDGIKSGLTSLAFDSGLSLVKEYWPWRWRPPLI